MLRKIWTPTFRIGVSMLLVAFAQLLGLVAKIWMPTFSNGRPVAG